MSSAPEDALASDIATAHTAAREDASASVANVPPPPPRDAATTVWTPVTLGPRTFASGDELMRYFGALRNELTLDQNMNEYEHAVTEALLRRGHEEAEKKLGCGVRSFQVRNHPQHRSRCFMVIRVDNTMEDFSYRKCAARLFPGYDPTTFKAERPKRDERSGRGRGGRDGGRGRDGRDGGRGRGFGRGGRDGGRGRGRGGGRGFGRDGGRGFGRDGGRGGGRDGRGGGRDGGRGRSRGGGRGGPDRGGQRFGGGPPASDGGNRPRFGRPY